MNFCVINFVRFVLSYYFFTSFKNEKIELINIPARVVLNVYSVNYSTLPRFFFFHWASMVGKDFIYSFIYLFIYLFIFIIIFFSSKCDIFFLLGWCGIIR